MLAIFHINFNSSLMFQMAENIQIYKLMLHNSGMLFDDIKIDTLCDPVLSCNDIEFSHILYYVKHSALYHDSS